MTTLSLPDSNKVSFIEQIYTISHIISVREMPPRSRYYRVGESNPSEHTNSSPTRTENSLALTSGIALLLCTRPGDAVAVTFEQKIKSVEFFISKKKPSSASEIKYISRIIEIVRGTPMKVPVTKIILLLAISECAEKIRSRLRKVVVERDVHRDLPLFMTKCFEDYVKQKLRLSVGMTGMMLMSLLFDHCEGLLDNWEVETVYQCMEISYHVGEAPDFEIVVPYEALRKRLKRLGEYWLAAAYISYMTTDNTIFERFRDGITFTEVRTLNPRSTTTINGTPHTILTRFASGKGLPISSHPPYVTSPALPPIRVQTAVHPELTLATFMMQRRITSATDKVPIAEEIKLGTSKALCWLCKEYIWMLQWQYRWIHYMGVSPTGEPVRPADSEFQVVIGRYGGKVKAGWKMPRGEVICRVGVEEVVEEVLVKLCGE